ncbi:MAG: BatD family protein [Flavobacteriaceae bacterium]|nr:BatD family protein [Flavobacteriaceae bacterium]
MRTTKNIFITIFLFLISICLFSQQKIDTLGNSKEKDKSIFDDHKYTHILSTRLKKNKKKIQVKSWTNKKIYKLSDTIILVIEANRIFKIWEKFNLPQLKKGITRSNLEIKNEKVISYSLIQYRPKQVGKIKIPRIKVKIDGKIFKTKRNKIKVIP